MKIITVKQYHEALKMVKQPLVIMGSPGLCKTSLPDQVARELGGVSHVIPVAQFSEPGDMLGCPYDVEVESEDGSLSRKTAYATPDYFPTKGKGFVIIDDFNRANTLIVQSLLHLAQYREFGSYRLPELVYDDKGNWISGFKLVFTGNMSEEGEKDYIVNDVDDAFFSRVISYQLKFDKLMWGKWARSVNIDEKFISFILKNNELVNLDDNPRAFSNGFLELKGVDDLDRIEFIMSGTVKCYPLLRSWLEKEWSELNFDSNDVYDDNKHKNLIKIFKGASEDGMMLFAERIATLNVKDINKKQQESLRKFFHLMRDVDRERFMVAFIPVNNECHTLTDDSLFNELV
jgi:hypothetical protein